MSTDGNQETKKYFVTQRIDRDYITTYEATSDEWFTIIAFLQEMEVKGLEHSMFVSEERPKRAS